MSLLFPELADARDGGGQTPASRGIESPLGRGGELAGRAQAPTPAGGEAAQRDAASPPPTNVLVEGNEECVAAFTAAFRLPVSFRTVRLLHDGTVRLELETAEGEPPQSLFLVEPTAAHWRRGPGFAIAFSGKNLPARFHAPLLRFLARYQKASLAAFATRVQAQPAAPDPPATPGLAGSRDDDDPLRLPDDVDQALFRSYGLATAWRTFLEDHDLYRGSCTQLRGNVATIMHRDIECASSDAPENVWGRGTFAGLATNRDPGPEPAESESDHGELMFDTDLTDRDVIMGGDARLDAALNAIAAMPRRPDLVLLNSTCISVVTGDDLEASAERARRKHGLSVTALGCIEHPVQSALLSQLTTVTRASTARTAVFLGAPRIAGFETVVMTLRAAGVVLEGPMLPDLPAGFVDAIGRASLFVVYDQPHTRHSVRQLLDQFPDVGVLAPSPPFSLDATRRFCFAVAEACGAGEAMERCWISRYAGLEAQWQALTARAARYRVALVSDHSNWQTRLWTRLGVPLLETLREMQFSIEVLVFSASGAAVAEGNDPHVRVRPFASQAELTTLLRESEAPLVYSEIRYDPRVTRSGHASVSLEDFRCGVEGSLATLAALVRRCELPWFRRYGVLAASAPSPSETPAPEQHP